MGCRSQPRPHRPSRYAPHRSTLSRPCLIRLTSPTTQEPGIRPPTHTGHPAEPQTVQSHCVSWSRALNSKCEDGGEGRPPLGQRRVEACERLRPLSPGSGALPPEAA